MRSGSARIQQVAWNLLTNAVKFTPPGGRVDVRLHRAGGRMELEVRDTGIGIDAQFLPFVFDRFRQGAVCAGRRQSGLGLGMSIAKHLVELHGGTIAAESRGPGTGALFRISLPLSRASGEVADIADIADMAGSDDRRPALPNLSRIEVLLVDDEPAAREALARLLEQYGARVRAVGSCAAARRAVTQLRPDVIVADIAMPEEDGYSLMRGLRRDERERHVRRIPALAVTGCARLEDRQRALAASFDDHLPKPVDPDRLLTAVAALARSTAGA
jgi:CheY-like chemotaxis protein